MVPLAKVMRDVLAAHLAEYPAREVEIEDRTDPHNPATRRARLVFSTAAGGPDDPLAVVAALAIGGPCGGRPKSVGLHALRHFYASLLIRHGESAKTVQRVTRTLVSGIHRGHLRSRLTGRGRPDREAVELALSEEINSVVDSVRI